MSHRPGDIGRKL